MLGRSSGWLPWGALTEPQVEWGATALQKKRAVLPRTGHLRGAPHGCFPEQFSYVKNGDGDRHDLLVTNDGLNDVTKSV